MKSVCVSVYKMQPSTHRNPNIVKTGQNGLLLHSSPGKGLQEECQQNCDQSHRCRWWTTGSFSAPIKNKKVPMGLLLLMGNRNNCQSVQLVHIIDKPHLPWPLSIRKNPPILRVSSSWVVINPRPIHDHSGSSTVRDVHKYSNKSSPDGWGSVMGGRLPSHVAQNRPYVDTYVTLDDGYVQQSSASHPGPMQTNCLVESYWRPKQEQNAPWRGNNRKESEVSITERCTYYSEASNRIVMPAL